MVSPSKNQFSVAQQASLIQHVLDTRQTHNVRGHSEPVITLSNVLFHLFTFYVHEKTPIDAVLLAGPYPLLLHLNTGSDRRSTVHRCAAQYIHCSTSVHAAVTTR